MKRALCASQTFVRSSAWVVCVALAGCGSGLNSSSAGPAMAPAILPTGDVAPVHDPSISYENGVYYTVSTDEPGTPANYLAIRSSTDKIHWKNGGYVFATVPAFVAGYFAPTVLKSLWAPDLSYFNGMWHLYYAASVFGSNISLIALATSPTLNPAAPHYGWTNHGIVISSTPTSAYNTIDPSVLVDTDANGKLTHVWMSYGSYFGGIYEREIDPASGMLLASNPSNVQLATRPGVSYDPIEATSLVKHNGFYYLFASFDSCCEPNAAEDNYKIAVGRATSPQGPFVDESGTPMLQGGGTILLRGGTAWTAPGAPTVLIDPAHGDLIAYHALDASHRYMDSLFVDALTWPNDWPVIAQ